MVTFCCPQFEHVVNLNTICIMNLSAGSVQKTTDAVLPASAHQESLGLVDIVVWSTLYTVLAREAPHSAGELGEGVGLRLT